jgi:hypothetical protein
MLLALLFFIKYYKQPTIRNAVLWQGSAIIATLFRIEGVVFLAFAPFFFLLHERNLKGFIRHFIKLNSILIPVAIATIITLFSIAYTSDGSSAALQQYLNYMKPSTMTSALRNIASEVQGLMPRLSSTESTLVVSSGLIALVSYKLIKNINLVYLAIWFIGSRKRWAQLSHESNIVIFFAFISTLPLIVLAGNHFFMSSRYTVLSVVLFSLIAYQYVEVLFYRLIGKRKYIAASALTALATIFFLDGIIHTGANKGNIIEASKWMRQNISPDSKVACNEGRLLFYSDKRCVHKVALERRGIVAADKIINNSNFEYLLLWIDHKNKDMQNYLSTNKQLILVKSFRNKKRDEVNIYKIRTN